MYIQVDMCALLEDKMNSPNNITFTIAKYIDISSIKRRREKYKHHAQPNT